DHGPHEVPEVAGVTDPDLLDRADHPVADLGPERLRHEHPRCRAALLPLVLEPAAYDRDGDLLWVRTRVSDDEVLAPGLPDEPWVATVVADPLADALPDLAENRGRPGEVDPRQIPAG